MTLWELGKFYVRHRPSTMSRDEAHAQFLRALHENNEKIRQETKRDIYEKLGLN